MLASTANSGCRGEGPFAAHKCRIPGERPEAPIGCGERHAGVHQLHAGEVRLEDHVDGQIAAIARVNELVLVTVNVKDFARFKDVEVENWSKRRR